MFKRERQAMLRDWNERMERNPTYYIAARGTDTNFRWDMDEFFRVGEEETTLLTQDFFKQNGFTPHDKVMLEIGCGIGRMTRAFAKIFRLVYALDISPVAIKLGQELNQEFRNIRWVVGNGVDLSGLKNKFFDLVFSYIVFQHIPVKEILFRYVQEIGRVMKTDGLVKFQVCNDPKLQEEASFPTCARKEPDTFASYYVHKDALLRKMLDAHLRCLRVVGEGTQYMWIEARRI